MKKIHNLWLYRRQEPHQSTPYLLPVCATVIPPSLAQGPAAGYSALAKVTVFST